MAFIFPSAPKTLPRHFSSKEWLSYLYAVLFCETGRGRSDLDWKGVGRKRMRDTRGGLRSYEGAIMFYVRVVQGDEGRARRRG